MFEKKEETNLKRPCFTPSKKKIRFEHTTGNDNNPESSVVHKEAKLM